MPTVGSYRPRRQPLIRAAAAIGEEAVIASRNAAPARVLEFAGIDPARISDPGLQLALTDSCRLMDIAASSDRGRPVRSSVRPGFRGAQFRHPVSASS